MKFKSLLLYQDGLQREQTRVNAKITRQDILWTPWNLLCYDCNDSLPLAPTTAKTQFVATKTGLLLFLSVALYVSRSRFGGY